MVELGYGLSSEEHTPGELVENARAAEEAGFTFALISDHFHPWIDRQGHSPFVWSVLGGLAEATEHMAFFTGVTCPLIRYHPAVVAQAAATDHGNSNSGSSNEGRQHERGFVAHSPGRVFVYFPRRQRRKVQHFAGA